MKITTASVLAMALLVTGCDSKKATSDASARPTAIDSAADARQARATLLPGAFEGLCSGRVKALPQATPRDPAKPTYIFFYQDEKTKAFTRHEAEAGSFFLQNMKGPPEAQIAACVEVVKKTELKSCTMTRTDGSGVSYDIKLVEGDVKVRLIEATTGKVLVDKVETLKHKSSECPMGASMSGDEDEWPTWEHAVLRAAKSLPAP